EITEDLDLMMDFISEAKEHLDSIEINMVNWEKDPQDNEIINSIFRPFHTIKGVAGFLNLIAVNRLSHQLENLLDEAREGRIELNPELSDLIFDGVDILKSLIETTEEAVQSGEAQEYTVDIDTFIQKISLFLNTAKMQSDLGDDVMDAPKEPIGEILVKEGKVNQDDIAEVLDKQKDQDHPKPIGEILVDEKKVTPRDVSDAIRKQKESAAPPAGKHIKVDTVKMDQLLDLVGELVIAQSMVTHNPEVEKITDQRFGRDISQLMRITSNLQNVSMSMRLVPIGATFQKMNRIVRDLSNKSGKKINLVLEGQSAEIDRNMVEELYDPLVHMIRNSCDHGIKTPDDRTSKGKPAGGTVTLKAEHVGGKVVITIADDGDGLDREAILSKAIEKGLVSADERPDDKTIDNLIFMAGFSTAKQVTDVSGRGVGMDVVRKAIEKLHGTAEITSRTGKGTEFTINLPLTTAIIDGMLVQLGTERYIIPTLSVRQLVHPQQSDMNTIIGRGDTVKVRDKILPLIKLNKVLKIKSNNDETENSVLVILEDNGEVVALQVDSVIGKQEVVIKNIDSSSEKMEGVAGGAILGDGRVGLILDIRSIVTSDGKMALRA
ncbi:chemotaxis protein CheA, partial [Candidatus Latescibacterota bacterium]